GLWGVAEIRNEIHDIGAILTYPFYSGPAPIWSNLFGGMVDANQRGEGALYFLNVTGNMASFGLLGLFQAAAEAERTGNDAIMINALGQYAGGATGWGGIIGALQRVFGRCFAPDTLGGSETGLRPICG